MLFAWTRVTINRAFVKTCHVWAILLHRRDDGCRQRWNGITIPHLDKLDAAPHRPSRLDGGSHQQQWHINIPTTLPFDKLRAASPLRRDARHPQLSHPRHGLRLHRSTPVRFRHGRDHGLSGENVFTAIGKIHST